MGFVNLQMAKCTSCGATIQVDPSQDAANCPYCNSAFIVEKAINNYSIDTVNVKSNGPIHIERRKSKYEIDAEKEQKKHETETRLLEDPGYREWKTKEDKRHFLFALFYMGIMFLMWLYFTMNS